mmetsp:Transcript_43506/g.124687  ORF Transcript_43506/g.124687 Transcript_43506/m.124687 type:complete len:308 (-) Transcript_43506:168-1091(-)
MTVMLLNAASTTLLAMSQSAGCSRAPATCMRPLAAVSCARSLLSRPRKRQGPEPSQEFSSASAGPPGGRCTPGSPARASPARLSQELACARECSCSTMASILLLPTSPAPRADFDADTDRCSPPSRATSLSCAALAPSASCAALAESTESTARSASRPLAASFRGQSMAFMKSTLVSLSFDSSHGQAIGSAPSVIARCTAGMGTPGADARTWSCSRSSSALPCSKAPPKSAKYLSSWVTARVVGGSKSKMKSPLTLSMERTLSRSRDSCHCSPAPERPGRASGSSSSRSWAISRRWGIIASSTRCRR